MGDYAVSLLLKSSYIMQAQFALVKDFCCYTVTYFISQLPPKCGRLVICFVYANYNCDLPKISLVFFNLAPRRSKFSGPRGLKDIFKKNSATLFTVEL